MTTAWKDIERNAAGKIIHMFSGIIKEVGKIEDVKRKKGYALFKIGSRLPSLHVGSSIAVNGVCQTVVETAADSLFVESLALTLQKTNLRLLAAGDLVNLEPALRLQDSVDGHLVQGHVQGTATVRTVSKIDENTEISLRLPPASMKFCVPEGSIALDGVSLTIARKDLETNTIIVSIVPYTLDHTIIGRWKEGSIVNVECDIIDRSMRELQAEQGRVPDVDKYLKPSAARAERALHELRRGRMVIVFDSETRENEGDFIIPAETATAAQIAVMAREGCGLICHALTRECAERLDLPPMIMNNNSLHQTAFTVSVDAAQGTTTGISAEERALTARLLASPQAKKEDFCRPGHLFPITAHPGGLEARQGHTEAAVALMELAGYTPSAVICEILNADGSAARLDDLAGCAAEKGLQLLSIADIIEYCRTRKGPGKAQKD